MIKRLKPKTEFSRNVLTLMTGTTVAQAIPIAISPILTRIYTPEDFGLYAIFIAIVAIFGSIVSGRYELAIMLPNKENDAINIFALALIITTVLSLLLLLLVILFNTYLTNIVDNKEISIWLYFIPITVFLTGLFNILNYFNNRNKYYKDIANATIIKSIVLASIQLSVGFIKSGATGLISGQIISQLFANTRLLKNIIKDKSFFLKINKVKIIALAKKYRNFPIYSMPAILANTLSQNLVNILIASLFNVSTVGFYSLAQRLLGMPSVLIGKAIGQVFFQEASEEKKRTGRAINSFISTVKKLIIIGLPSFGILFFIVEDLFSFIFGETWRVSGEYAQIVLPLFFIRFVSSTVSGVLIIFEKQKNELYINLLLFGTSIPLIFIFDDFKIFLGVFTSLMSLNYLVFLFYYYNLAKGIK